MATKNVKTKGTGANGGKSRYMTRAEAKEGARVGRRAEDKAAAQEETTMARVDIRIENQGSVFVIHLLSQAAKDFVDKFVQVEGWQWLGSRAFGVDHRYAADLAQIFEENDLVVR